MNRQIEFATQELRAAIADFLVPIQMTKVADKDAFERIENHTIQLMGLLKNEELVSKSLLAEWYIMTGIMRAEAPHLKEGVQEMEEMASKIDDYFYLILKGEVPEDRVPGVPRVV